MYVVYDSESGRVLLSKEDWGDSVYKWVNSCFWQTYTQSTPWELLTCESLPVLARDLVDESTAGQIVYGIMWDDDLEEKIEKLNHIKIVHFDEDGELDFFESYDIDVELYQLLDDGYDYI